MIDREHLNELIKKKATVYGIIEVPFIMGYSHILKIKEIKLDKYYSVSEDANPTLYYTMCIRDFVCEAKNLYKTKEDAEFAMEYQNTTRIETLNFPTWEDRRMRYAFISKEGLNMALYCIDDKIQIEELNDMASNRYFYDDLTKENYLKACEIAKKLFLGEEIDNGNR